MCMQINVYAKKCKLELVWEAKIRMTKRIGQQKFTRDTGLELGLCLKLLFDISESLESTGVQSQLQAHCQPTIPIQNGFKAQCKKNNRE